MTVTHKGSPPTLADAAEQLGLGDGDLNAGFGVVPIDPEKGTYCVEAIADRLPSPDDTSETYHGPYSNPTIEGADGDDDPGACHRCVPPGEE